MAQISFNIPDAKVTELLDAFCTWHGWTDTVTVNGSTVANPESQIQFVRRTLREIYVGPFKQLRAKAAAEAAAIAAQNEVQ